MQQQPQPVPAVALKPARVVSLDDARASRERERQQQRASRSPVLDAWMLYQAKGYLLGQGSSSTRASYTTIMTRAAEELDEFTKLTTGDVQSWVIKLHTERGLCQSYARQHLEVLKAVTTAVALSTHDHVLSDIVRAAKCKWRQQPPRARCPPRDLYVRTLPLCRNEGERCFLRLLGYGGLRVGEVRGLALRDWDRRAHTLTIERQLENDRRKNKSLHVVHLSEATEIALRWVVMNRDKMRPSRGPTKRVTDGRLFPWGSSYLDHFIARLRAGLGDEAALYFPPGDAWHTYRHWGASELAHQGKREAEIMTFLGDASSHVARSYVDAVRGTTRGNAMACLERVSMEAAQQELRGLADNVETRFTASLPLKPCFENSNEP